jgi:protein gp37
MAITTKIAWTDATFNPWRGCVKVSEGCAHCYAEGWAKRTGKSIWGRDAAREHASESYWKQPEQWNEAAARTGKPFRVFCGSLMDVCEDRPDLWAPRERLISLIENTPALTWLLCTKRPENYTRLFARWLVTDWPRNVWALATAENQQQANERIPYLLRLPVVVRGVSIEPQLGPVSLFAADAEGLLRGPGVIVSGGMTPRTPHEPPEGYDDSQAGIDWVIVGGESGPGARPFALEWAYDLKAECLAAGVPFFMKQVGSNSWRVRTPLKAQDRVSRNGDALEDIPHDLQSREFPMPEVSRVR